MSSCRRGGAYSMELEMVKSPPSHNTPSPSSTISETNSPPLAISTRRPRTSRKRRNQTYDEAEALLSTAYPNIFSSKKIKTHTFSTKSPLNDYDEASQFLLLFDSFEKTDSLFNPTMQTKPDHFFKHTEVSFDESETNRFGFLDDFDTESILDEEIEEGIESFMGNIESNDGESEAGIGRLGETMMNPLFESSIGFRSDGNFQPRFGLRRSLRENDDEDWWKYSTVEFEQISPRLQTTTTVDDGQCQSKAVDSSKNETIEKVAGDKKNKKKKKKKKKNKNKVAPVVTISKSSEEPCEQRVSPLLKLDYDGILEAWSDKESPFSDEILDLDGAGIDFHKIRLGEIDLFGESGMREASVLRYKEKRRNRLFSSKIRYQVRKLNADQRPRMQGRFVRRPNARNLSGLRF